MFGIDVTVLTLIQLPNMVKQSVPITKLHFWGDINNNWGLN